MTNHNPLSQTLLLYFWPLEILTQNQKNWYPFDKTTYEGNIIETNNSHFGLHQLIPDPTQFLGKSSSCIDVNLTSQPKMIGNSGVHSSLHTNCHRQTIFAKFIFLHHTNKKFGITKRLMPFLSDEQFMNLTGKGLCQIKYWWTSHCF